MPEPVVADNADVGATIQSDSWEVTLLDQPIKDYVIDGPDGGVRIESDRELTSLTAEGVWIIVPIQLKNIGEEEAMLFQKTITVADDQGRTYEIGDRHVHHAQIWEAAPDRWGDRENQLIQNVQDAEAVREGPALFDVAEDATGLRLVLNGSSDTISLGFD